MLGSAVQQGESATCAHVSHLYWLPSRSGNRRAGSGVPTQHSQWRLGGPEGGFTVPGVWEPGTPWETLRPAETRLAEGVELDA